MPVLNEAKSLYHTLSALNLSNSEELIIVDGGSADNTISIAREFTDKVFQTKTGRARVMNFGAGKAEGGCGHLGCQRTAHLPDRVEEQEAKPLRARRHEISE